MDAIDLLTSDHDQVRKLFDQFRQAKDGDDTGRMRELKDEIFSELETHTRIEEDVFYPAVRDVGDDELNETVAEGLQEHHIVNTLMREIGEISGDETFAAKMTVLIENVEHHADEEEDDLFPRLRLKMSESRLTELGAELEAAK